MLRINIIKRSQFNRVRPAITGASSRFFFLRSNLGSRKVSHKLIYFADLIDFLWTSYFGFALWLKLKSPALGGIGASSQLYVANSIREKFFFALIFNYDQRCCPRLESNTAKKKKIPACDVIFFSSPNVVGVVLEEDVTNKNHKRYAVTINYTSHESVRVFCMPTINWVNFKSTRTRQPHLC